MRGCGIRGYDMSDVVYEGVGEDMRKWCVKM